MGVSGLTRPTLPARYPLHVRWRKDPGDASPVASRRAWGWCGYTASLMAAATFNVARARYRSSR